MNIEFGEFEATCKQRYSLRPSVGFNLRGTLSGVSALPLLLILRKPSAAARRGADAVYMKDIEEAVGRVTAGLEKKTRVITPREKAIIAHHEIGHALTAACLPHMDPVRKVSIIPRGSAALGYPQHLPTADRYLMTKSELENRLCVLLGGRAAEELIFGDVSTGAIDDLQKATDTARSMVTEYGMSPRLGLRAFEKERRSLFLHTIWATKKDYSEEKAAEIDKEVEEILAHAYQRVHELLATHKPLLERLAAMLLEKEVRDGEEVRSVIRTERSDNRNSHHVSDTQRLSA